LSSDYELFLRHITRPILQIIMGLRPMEKQISNG